MSLNIFMPIHGCLKRNLHLIAGWLTGIKRKAEQQIAVMQ